MKLLVYVRFQHEPHLGALLLSRKYAAPILGYEGMESKVGYSRMNLGHAELVGSDLGSS